MMQALAVASVDGECLQEFPSTHVVQTHCKLLGDTGRDPFQKRQSIHKHLSCQLATTVDEIIKHCAKLTILDLSR